MRLPENARFVEFTVLVHGNEPHKRIADVFDDADLRFREMNPKVVNYSHTNGATVTAVKKRGYEWKVTVFHPDDKTLRELHDMLEAKFWALSRAN